MFGVGYSLVGFHPGSRRYNLIDVTNPQGVAGVAVADMDYYFDDTGFNPHTYQAGQSMDHVLNGVVFDAPQGAVGDLIGAGSGSGPHTLSLTNSLVLPTLWGGSPGKLVSPARSGLTYTVDHNTVVSTSAQGLNAETGPAEYGETFGGVAGMYASVRSNLVYSPTGKGAFLLRHVTGSDSEGITTERTIP